MIEGFHDEVKQRYGSPRITPELNDRGHTCSVTMAAKLMKVRGSRAKAPKRFIRTADSSHKLPVAENLLARDFDPAGPDEA